MLKKSALMHLSLEFTQVDAHVITPEEYEETTETNLSRAEFAITGVVQPHPRQQNHSPPPQEVAATLSLSQEVLSYFQAGGQGWQARVDGRSGSGLPHTDQHRHTCSLA